MPSPDVLVIEREAWKQALLGKDYPGRSSVRLVVEVLSPSNCEESLRLKVDLYKKHSIEVWVIDPDHSLTFDGQIIELADIFKSSV